MSKSVFVSLLLCLGLFSFDLKVEKVYKSGSFIKIPIEFSEGESPKDIKKITVNGAEKDVVFYGGKAYLFHVEDVQYFSKVLKLEAIPNEGKKKTYVLHLVNGAPKEIGRVSLDQERVKLRSDREKMIKENQFFHPYFLKKREPLEIKDKWIIPLKGTYYTTSLFGKKREYTGQTVSYHRGTDLVPAKDKNIYAPQSGVVVYSGLKDIRGNIVIIYHGYELYTSYWHMSERLVEEGDEVKIGQVIGVLGSTGISSGPHLHWEARYNNVIFDAMDLLKF